MRSAALGPSDVPLLSTRVSLVATQPGDKRGRRSSRVFKGTVLMPNSCSLGAADAGEDPANASGRRSGRRCGGRPQVQPLSANARTGLARRDARSFSGTGAQRSWQVGPRGSPGAAARHTRRGARAVCDLRSGAFRAELAQPFLRCWGDVSASRRAAPRRREACAALSLSLPLLPSPSPAASLRGVSDEAAGAAPASSR